MTDTILHIKQWGKDLGIRLPDAIVCAAGLHVDQRVRVSVKEGAVVICPLASIPTLEERLAQFSPARHGGEFPQPL